MKGQHTLESVLCTPLQRDPRRVTTSFPFIINPIAIISTYSLFQTRRQREPLILIQPEYKS